MPITEQTIKSGRPFLPVTDGDHLKIGDVAGVGVGKTETWGPLHKTTFSINNLSIAVTDSGGAAGGQGSQKICDLPEGVVAFIAAFYNLTTLAATGIGATAALIGSLGTAAAGAGDSTLTGTEANIIPSTIGTLTGSAGVLKNFSAAPGVPIDGTTTPVDIILNLAVPDAGITANSSVVVNGTVTVFWFLLGDY